MAEARATFADHAGRLQGIGTAKRTLPALLTVHTRLPGASPSRRACGLLTTRAMERGSAVEGVGRQRRTALLSPIMPVDSKVSAPPNGPYRLS